MNVLILAAGYATRLYPLTLTKAKPLLEVAGKPMIEWVMDNLAPVGDIDTVYVVTNNKFAQDFQTWAKGYEQRNPERKLKVVNDGSMDDSDKLGAIGDINLVIEREKLECDDLIVVAGDNLFSEPLTDFAAQMRGSEATLATYDVGDLEAIKKYSAITMDDAGMITSFEEKPQVPKSTLTGIALYGFARETIPLFAQYMTEGNNPDQPGRFIQWLYPRKRVKTFQITGTWFDIGSKETLEEANEIFRQFAR
ncbi:MAG: nucleotidyltransferase family protein [Chthoniobacterales bacterium]